MKVFKQFSTRLRFIITWDVEVDNRSNPVNSWDVEATDPTQFFG